MFKRGVKRKNIGFKRGGHPKISSNFAVTAVVIMQTAYQNAKNLRFRLSKKKKKKDYSVGGEAGGGGDRGRSVAPPKQKFGVVLKNTFKDVFDNTCNIGDFRSEHIFCPQTTQELPITRTMKQNHLNNCTNRLRKHLTLRRLQRCLLVPTNDVKGFRKTIV